MSKRTNFSQDQKEQIAEESKWRCAICRAWNCRADFTEPALVNGGWARSMYNGLINHVQLRRKDGTTFSANGWGSGCVEYEDTLIRDGVEKTIQDWGGWNKIVVDYVNGDWYRIAGVCVLDHQSGLCRHDDDEIMRLVKDTGRAEFAWARAYPTFDDYEREFSNTKLLSRLNLNIHHIVPSACGGESSIENGICLCDNCHNHSGIVKLAKQFLVTGIRDPAWAVGVLFEAKPWDTDICVGMEVRKSDKDTKVGIVKDFVYYANLKSLWAIVETDTGEESWCVFFAGSKSIMSKAG